MEGKEFEPSDIVDAYLVIAATNEPCVNEAVKQALPEHTLFNNVEMHQMAMLSSKCTTPRQANYQCIN